MYNEIHNNTLLLPCKQMWFDTKQTFIISFTQLRKLKNKHYLLKGPFRDCLAIFISVSSLNEPFKLNFAKGILPRVKGQTVIKLFVVCFKNGIFFFTGY